MDRRAVTRSRVQRLPLPVTKPLRFKSPAIRSSPAMRTGRRTASMMSGAVLLRGPRRGFGRRRSVWTPPA